ncbi:MAG: TetR/AcrR family transcriptional regulator C-terminal domain-containing protein [Deltaproteobacteria bacterium]|nr:TetR/AcrR family transcriptional regulator C-terminal domain-containing protein [Deltaproteobacteria bacterium]
MKAAPAKRGRPRGRPPKDPAGALSQATIRSTALALIDRDGLDEFSIRKLGTELRCEAMAIYWYYESKDALLDAVVDELMAPVGAIAGDPPGDWVEMLRAIARSYRRIARVHPHAFPLLATRRFATEQTFEFLDRLFAYARGQGVADRDAARFYRIVGSYCSGFALSELAARRDDAPQTAALRTRFPRVAEVTEFLNPRHLDEIFEQGLELLLAEVARASARKPARRKETT